MYELTGEIINKVFDSHGIIVNKIRKLDIGFTNDIYVVDDCILKVCKDLKNEVNFVKEIFFYKFFKNIISVPNLQFYNTDKDIIKRYYMIYEKVDGDNLFSVWHNLNTSKRKNIVKQLAETLKKINDTDFTKYKKEFNLDDFDWHTFKYNSIVEKLKIIKDKNIINSNTIRELETFIKTNHTSLKEQVLGLTYYDLHFDNVIVDNDKVNALIDFERVGFFSIDYALDTIKRLTERPFIYVNEKDENHILVDDYKEIFSWFKEYYPELFDFSDLNKRLALYAIEYDLKLLIKFPDVESLKERLISHINIKY